MNKITFKDLKKLYNFAFIPFPPSIQLFYGKSRSKLIRFFFRNGGSNVCWVTWEALLGSHGKIGLITSEVRVVEINVGLREKSFTKV